MKRVRVRTGIYEDKWGLIAIAGIKKRQKAKRFPPGTDLDKIQSWRLAAKFELDQDEQDAIAVVRGTLEHDAAKFLQRKEGTTDYKAVRSHLRAWFPKLGKFLRSKITRDNIEQQLAIWRDGQVAAWTIRKRCLYLRMLYRSLDGTRARTPLDQVKPPRKPTPHPTSVPLKTIQRVAVNLLNSGLDKDYARFLVRATTGQRPTQIMRATPDDVDLHRKLWFVRASKDGLAIPLPLSSEMVKAWKLFAKAEAWGQFDTTAAARVLHAHGWPKGVRPYQLRHTWAIDLLDHGVDMGVLQGLMGHRSILTTKSNYGAISMQRLKAAVKLLKPVKMSGKRKSA